VISSTAATADPTDYELRIDVTGTVTLHADIQLAGSLAGQSRSDRRV
jgi:hypothetical protein